MVKINKIVNIGIVGPKGYALGGYDFNDRRRKILNEYLSHIFQIESINKTVVGYCGLNSGSDYEFAKTCNENRIPYYIYLSNENEQDSWISNIKERNLILNSANEVQYLYKGEYSPKKNMNRTKMIIENSDIVIYVKNKLKNKCSILNYILNTKKTIYYINI
jgi:hypothetical protein